ncbi:MAG: helix-turn-helix domain-containing protein [Gemmatimonadaceae bacterium]
MDIGRVIRTHRKTRGITIEGLASGSGVSRAMVSDIERGVKNPTIKVVSQIAAALDLSVSDLLDERSAEAASGLSILRAGERRVLVDPESGVERHVLAPTFQRHGIEVLWYTIPPEQSTGNFPPHQVGVEEHITVVQGRLHALLGLGNGKREVTLERGDSMAFQADLTHEFRNLSAEPCHYFLIIDASRAGTRR